MTRHIKIGVLGVSGRMGQTLLQSILNNERLVLCGVTEKPGHAWEEQKLSKVFPEYSGDLVIKTDPNKAFFNADVAIDFTSPASSVAMAKFAAELGIVHVVGTTGLSQDNLEIFAECSKKTPIIHAGNMSLGINLLAKLTERIASALDEDFDIEIIEAHHRYKIDAPSGTALMLGEAAARGRGKRLNEIEDRGRDGHTGERKRGNIGFSAIRGGNIVGEHDVMFSADGERIILSHIATDRTIYARGAIKAALWGVGKSPGLYDMCDVLGL